MCTCASCKYTDSFHGWKAEGEKLVPDPEKGGFDRWPKGDPAGKRASNAAYAAHVSHLWKGVSRNPATNMDPVSYYGTSGTTRAEVLRVLRQTFGLEPMPEKPEAPKPAAPVLSIVPKAPKTAPVADDLAEFVRRKLAA
jgi:hypothetical protein